MGSILWDMNERPEMSGAPKEWAESMFGGCELGDVRRTRRLVDYAGRQAANPGGTIHEVCAGDGAAAEAAYRLMRNNAIEAAALEAGPLARNAARCAGVAVVLAIQDTTTLSYSHAASEQMGTLGGGRGFVVHSTLAVDGTTRDILGLVDQQRWSRPATTSKRGNRSGRAAPYEERESYKWELASQNIEKRLDSMDNVIQVCDREADIYEYLQARTERGHRYVVRANHDRQLRGEDGSLWASMAAQTRVGVYEVLLGQRGAEPATLGRGARPARQTQTTRMAVKTASVRLRSPTETDESISVNIIYAREITPRESTKPLEWMLLTSEPIESLSQAVTVIEYYETRWLIEEFHNAWKSGCTIEQRRLQAPASLERLAIITAHIAVRLLQLRCLTSVAPELPADVLLEPDEWQCLHLTTQPRHSLPTSPPSLRWVLETIAKLGGWRDTKRTGRIGWLSLWRGWRRFQERLVAWKIAKQHR